MAPDVAADAAGDVTVVWVFADATTATIEVADRAGGGFSAPVPISEAGETSFVPEIATSAGGRTAVIWQLGDGTNSVVQAASRAAPGAGFSSPEDVSAAQGQEFGPKLAANGSGEMVVAWSALSGPEQIVQASIAKPGAGFSPPAEISPTSPEIMRPAVTIGGSGDATVLWPRSNGTNAIIQFAGYDITAPQLRALAIPATGTVGIPVQFSVSPFDVWPLAPATFSFGDGATAVSNAPSHIYVKPGVYRAEATVADGAGTAAMAAGRVEVGPRRDFKIGKLRRNKRKGTGTLTVTVGGPGTVILRGPKLRKALVMAPAAGAVSLPVGARGGGRRALARHGRLTTRATVVFNPEGGAGSSRSIGVKLIRKHG